MIVINNLLLSRLWRLIALVLLVVFIVPACVTQVAEREFHAPVFPPPPDEPRFIWERAILSSADAKPDEDGDAFKRIITGARKGGVGMGKPYGIVVHQGRVFIGDTASRSVMALDFVKGDFFFVGDGDGAGQIYKPLGMTMDAAANLYVVDGSDKNVKIFTRDGDWITTIGKKGDFSRPTGVAVTPDGSRLYIVDTGGVNSEKHHVMVFDVMSGEHLFTIGKRGDKPGEFNLPNNAMINTDGNLYVVDGGNFRVQVFTPEGKFIKMVGSVGRQFGQFSRPKGIAHDTEGNIYIADAAFGNFQIFNQEGKLLLFVGGRGPGGPAEYFLPAGIAVDEDGRVYMADQFYQKIGVFRPYDMAPEDGYLGRQLSK